MSRSFPYVADTDVTSEALYLRRRHFLAWGTAGALGAAAPLLLSTRAGASSSGPTGATLTGVRPRVVATDEKPTAWRDATTYNNYYEFGTAKSDPSEHAGAFRTRPWTLTFEGEIAKPQVVDVDRLLTWAPLEERIYRMRCVEGWSMVLPWVGMSLGELIRKVEPTSAAKYVAFSSVHDPEQMPGQRRRVLDWPYVEGLRMDEAMHPLSLLAIGIYGRNLPNQNGAPLRLVVPWKYGFKGIKAITKIRFVRDLPSTTWNTMAPDEYGFLANVNPEVDHPRWSQGKERRIGDFFRRKTLPFNGYADQVASLYAGMDLRKNF